MAQRKLACVLMDLSIWSALEDLVVRMCQHHHRDQYIEESPSFQGNIGSPVLNKSLSIPKYKEMLHH